MSDSPQSAAPQAGTTKGAQYQAKHAQLQQRALRYKKRIALAAVMGFGCVSFLIARPDFGLSALAAANTSASNASQTNNDDTSNSFFNQQGGNSNNGTSQQSPFTRSGGS